MPDSNRPPKSNAAASTMEKRTRATKRPREPERLTCRTKRTGPYRTNVANSGTRIRNAPSEYHGPTSCRRVTKNAGTTSNAHTTQKSRVKRNGRSMACMGRLRLTSRDQALQRFVPVRARTGRKANPKGGEGDWRSTGLVQPLIALTLRTRGHTSPRSNLFNACFGQSYPCSLDHLFICL